MLNNLALKLASTTLRAWPFPNGTGRIVSRYAKSIDTGSGYKTCVTSNGFPMTVIANDYIGRHLILAGRHDKVFVDTLLAFGDRGDRCLDIGANIGYVAGVILTVLPESHLHCVEPQPQVADLLRQNLGQFPAQRWEVLEAALSDVEAEGVLHIDEDNRGASSLKDLAGSSQSFAVQMIPADTYLGAFDRLDLVKIDIEGYEETVLRSAKAQLDRLHPRAILFEDHEGKSVPGGAIHAILDDLGYDIYAIKKKLMGVRLIPVQADLAGYDDFIAVSRRRPLPLAGRKLIG